ncbi:glucosaminidase domain-containing protein [Dictyobacter arantiisoli]|uniref:Mannosyl-glycoprotein endo-beta-N-acetylglucosamidase-like domain-containing protein n=1 Tax=Dictyobacter arantiisoli TaxID=2014874 RepID=A0A5A5THP8_9CHLR|nr:glucosaminidase domain-containing protein [Dictyobacter arantiisoli]GCF10666.1 hypothetical protein KDI_42300 [Dictyobacter arantiisoli]
MFGTIGEAHVTLSLGNLRCYKGVACVDQERGGGYAKYSSWEQGFHDWYALIHNYYVARGLTTIDKVIPVYAPTPNNADAGYIQSIKHIIDTWHAGSIMK